MPNRKQRRRAAALARRAAHRQPIQASARPARPGSSRPQTQLAARGTVAITGAEAPTAEAPARFRMVANTGEPMQIWRFEHPVVIDLETADLSDQRIPALYDHAPWIGSIVGQVETLAIEQKALIAAGRFTIPARDATERPGCGEEVLRLARAGYQWQASVGGDPATLETIEAGATGTANWGRQYPGPCVIARGARFREISFVVLGADRRTSVVTAANGSSPMTFEEWLLAMGFDDPTALTDIQRANLQLKYNDEVGEGDIPGASDGTGDGSGEPTGLPPTDSNTAAEPTNAAATPPTVQAAPAQGANPPQPAAAGRPGRRPSPPTNSLAARRAELAAEERRVAALRQVCASAPDMQIEVGSGASRQSVPLLAYAIEAGWDRNRTELEVLRRRRPDAPAAIVRSHERDATLQAFEGAMILRCGGRLDHPAYTSPRGLGVMADGRPKLPAWLRAGINDANRNRIMEAASRYSDMSAVDLCCEAIRLDGRELPHGRGARIQAAISGLNLLNVFTTSINAILLSTYFEAEDTTMGWVREQDVADYRLQERPRMNKGPRLTKRAKGGAADHATRDDSGETYKIAHYAQQIEVDEIDFVNDNLSALSDLPVEMGYAAARLRPDLVYAIILSNPTLAATTRALFNATDGNAITTAALSSTTLKAAVAKMLLVQENGVNLGLSATHLLTPPGLMHTGRELINSATVFKATGENATVEFGSSNSIQVDALTLVSDARLENGVIDPDSGDVLAGSSTDWFLICAIAHTIEVGYLRGTGRSPRVRSWRHDRQGQYGMGWDIDMSIGAASLDWKGLQKNSA